MDLKFRRLPRDSRCRYVGHLFDLISEKMREANNVDCVQKFNKSLASPDGLSMFA